MTDKGGRGIPMPGCSAIKDSGERCRGIPIRGTQWCVAHHPDYDAARKRGGVKGGKRGGRGRPVQELAALRSENSELRDQLLRGEVEPRVAAVATQMINVDARLIDLTLKAKEQVELEQRLEEIEQVLAVRKRGYTYGGS
jgi:hypothetical protein